jgi:hypothetical protein
VARRRQAVQSHPARTSPVGGGVTSRP